MNRLTENPFVINSEYCYEKALDELDCKFYRFVREIENFMEEQGIMSVEDLEDEYKSLKIDKACYKDINQKIFQENQKLKDIIIDLCNQRHILWNKWNELNQWVIKEQGYSSMHQEERYQAFDDVLDKMQELDKGERK